MSLYAAILAFAVLCALHLGRETWSTRSYLRARLPRAWRRHLLTTSQPHEGIMIHHGQTGERIIDERHARQRQADGWTRATCSACNHPMMTRGPYAPCCSTECAKQLASKGE